MERLPRRGIRYRDLSRAAHGLIMTLSRTRAMEQRSRLLRALRAVGYPWVRVVDRGAAPEPPDEITLPRAMQSPPRHPEMSPPLQSSPLSSRASQKECWARRRSTWLFGKWKGARSSRKSQRPPKLKLCPATEDVSMVGLLECSLRDISE